MNTHFFNIAFEFRKDYIIQTIEKCIYNKQKCYICVVDGNIISEAYANLSYRNIVNNSKLNICDSSWIPIFVKWIYKRKFKSFTGNDLFLRLINKKKYNYLFLGATPIILKGLKEKLVLIDPRIAQMNFISLPFCSVENFNYISIAESINAMQPDIIWVSLGAPKQEIFMNKILPLVTSGVFIAVGAVFKYQSGLSEKRAPKTLIKYNLEWLYRGIQEPKKNFKRIFRFLKLIPILLYKEYKSNQKSINHL